MVLTSLSDAEWSLEAVSNANTFERLLGLAACFILDGPADYKADPVFDDVRKAYAAKIASFGFFPDDIRSIAAKDPVRAVDEYVDHGWADVGPNGFITAADIANSVHATKCPDATATPPHRATVSAVKAGSGAPYTSKLFE